MLQWVRVLGLTAACGALAAMGAVAVAMPRAGAAPAAAPPNPVCTLLPALCPPTPPPATAPPTTKAPAPTTTVARGAATTTPPTTAKRATTVGSGQASVGAPGAVVSPAELTAPSTPAAADSPAPELAGPGVSTTSLPAGLAPRSAALGNLSRRAGGPPNHHSRLRIVLSLIALVLAVLAATQLPAARRRSVLS